MLFSPHLLSPWVQVGVRDFLLTNECGGNEDAWLGLKRHHGFSCFLPHAFLISGETDSHEDTQTVLWRDPPGEELKPCATATWWANLKADPLAPIKPSENCSLANILTAVSRETLTHGRSTVASGIKPQSQMSIILIGPSFHPQGAETSCATWSGICTSESSFVGCSQSIKATYESCLKVQHALPSLKD